MIADKDTEKKISQAEARDGVDAFETRRQRKDRLLERVVKKIEKQFGKGKIHHGGF